LGFAIKDTSGQVLLGDNTYLTTRSESRVVEKGHYCYGRFRFQMPILQSGEYILNATVATGTQDDHRMQHWLHNAMILRSENQSQSTGLVGIPMMAIRLKTEESQESAGLESESV
jgi:lipopolysaccharide transport system ATP-binding protein